MVESALPSAADRKAFERFLGHYAVAVATKLLDEGIPVTSFDVNEPGTTKEGTLDEGGIWIHLSTAFSRQVAPVGQATLDWSESSGWSVNREVSLSAIEDRYLGHGLTPDPDRVAVFATAVQVDPVSAGSLERPYYRRPGAPYSDLFARLEQYLPRQAESPELAFRGVRARRFEGRVAAALAADPPGPTLALPLTPGELTALELLLEYAAGEFMWGGVEVVEALAQDLSGRRRSDPARIEEFRTNLALAQARIEDLRSAAKRRRAAGED